MNIKQAIEILHRHFNKSFKCVAGGKIGDPWYCGNPTYHEGEICEECFLSGCGENK